MHKVFTIAFGVFLTACGAFDEDKDSKQETPPGTLSLIGVANSVYVEDCAVRDNGKTSSQETIFFYDSSFEKVWSNFDGTDCNPELRRTTYVSSFVDVREEVRSELEGYRKFLMDTGTFTATVHLIGLAKSFNKRSVYGYTDWELNRPKEINGRKYDDDSKVELSKNDGREVHVAFEDNLIRLARYVDDAPVAAEPYIYKKK